MHTDLRFSIITPTYNRAYILSRAIQSVCAQTYGNWELIIIDDGSTDKTRACVEAFRDARIRYVYQERTHQTIARNNAFQFVTGGWVAYLDSDNSVRPQYLETIASSLARHPETIWGFPCGTRILQLYENGTCIKTIDDSSEFSKHITVQDIFHRTLHTDMTGAFHSRTVIEDGVRFDPNVPKMEDWDFFLILSERYPNAFLFIPDILYDYYQQYGTDGVVSNSSYREWAELFKYIYHKHKNAPLMAGQQWYPQRVHKWNKLADEFEKGLLPPYDHYYFRNI